MPKATTSDTINDKTTTGKTILVVEDEAKLAKLLYDYLVQAGYQAHIIDNGLDVNEWVKQNQPDLILLDLMLPGKDGMEICKDIRQFSEVPIIMVTARVEEIDRLLGLELGADDYVCKPYSPREVLARIKAILRRVQGTPINNMGKASVYGFELDESRYKASIHGKVLALTAVEFQLLKILLSDPGRIFSRDQLMDHIYDDHRIVSDRTIDSHIKKLRKRLAEVLPEKEIIYSVYGVGYKFEEN